MAGVDVLRSGFSEAQADGAVRAAGSITLVTSDKRVLVDTGGPGERELLIALLQERELQPDQIDVVVCTHGHTDHVGNLGLFPRATFIMGQDSSLGETFTTLDLSAGPVTITREVRVMATSGHTSEDISVLVETPDGTVAIVGDVFENSEDGEAWVHYSRDPQRQRRSREQILAVADFIVPGHGPMFAVRR